MQSSDHSTLDDILFEQRNRDYGSYRLRKQFIRRLAFSFLLSLVLILALIMGYFWYVNVAGDAGVYLFPSSSPYVKSVPGSLMNAEELQAYLSEPEPVDPSLPSKQPDPTSIPVVVENVVDTSPSNQQDQDSSEDDAQTTEMIDSSYFGGFLLGEGLGGGSDNSLDRFPVFPGGTEGVRRYLEMNVKYPNLAIKQKISGVVLVSFRVNKFGEVDHIKVERGINALIDLEAIKAIEAMPRWKPGMRHGKPINVTFIIPVNFMPLG